MLNTCESLELNTMHSLGQRVIKNVLLLYFSEGGKLITLRQEEIYFLYRCMPPPSVKEPAGFIYATYSLKRWPLWSNSIRLWCSVLKEKRQERQIWHPDALTKQKMFQTSNLLLCLVFALCFFILCFSSFSPQLTKRSNVSLKMDQWFQIRTAEKKAGRADIKGRGE